jgi:hypothetical protein
MDFATIKNAVAKQFDAMSKGDLFRTEVEKDVLWDTYLASFPEGTNPIYRERTEHDCSCCRQYIRAVGNVVAIKDNKLVSIWDCKVDDPNYQIVVDALAALVKSKPIDNVFTHFEAVAGTDKNFEETVNGVKTWTHFFSNIPAKFVKRGAEAGPFLGLQRSTFDVLLRSLRELTEDSVETVLELIAQKSLYRGEEHEHTLVAFRNLQKTFKGVAPAEQENYAWSLINTLPQNVSRVRNTAIGTLLINLSKGDDLDAAVGAFEAMVAPTNYKRPTALVTKSMIEAAKKAVEELGLVSALERRYATINDITVNNILFADRSTPSHLSGDVFDTLSAKAENPKSFDKVEEVGIDDFIANVLPKAASIEVMMDNVHASNLVSLIAPSDPTALPMFKWGNRFSWSYNGEMADSIKERVKKAGGNVTGDLCCRLAWEYKDDLDFHMHESSGSHIYFSSRQSVCGGVLDVDANGGNGMMAHPVENIFYRSLATMREGEYSLSVHNFSRRSDGVGFEVEIDIGGQIHSIVYDKVVKNHETVKVAKLKYTKQDGVKLVESLPSTTAVKSVWGVDTNTFQPVDVVMMSPNHWDGEATGNKHYFFMLRGCRNDGKARGFFNEFLNNDLNQHRKVLEMVGSKMKTEESDHQLSGLGFSSTQKNSLLCRVKGSFTRVVKIVF